MSHASEENIEISLEKYEEEYDRLDNDVQRIVDRSERLLKIYLLTSSVLVTGVSLGSIGIPEPLWWRIPAFIAVLSVNGIYLKKTFDILEPKEFKKIDYDLEDESSTLPRSKIRESKPKFLGYMVEGIGDIVSNNKKNLIILSEEFEELHPWFFLSLVFNILIVITLSVI